MKSSSIHSVRRSLALAAVVTGLAVPAASAAPIEPVGSDPGNQKLAEAYSVPPLEFPSSPAPAPSANDGFDWGDAGIGATSVLALAAIAAGTAIVVGHRPRRGQTVA